MDELLLLRFVYGVAVCTTLAVIAIVVISVPKVVLVIAVIYSVGYFTEKIINRKAETE